MRELALPTRGSGFTLIEAVMTVALLAVVMTIAVPNLRAFLQNNRASAHANDLVTAVQMARSEALKRGSEIQLCSSSDQAACGGQWGDGWIVRDTGSGTVLQAWDGLRGKGVVDNTDSLPGEIAFESSGRTDLDAAVVIELRFPGCMRNANRDIELRPTGRVAVSRMDCP